MMKIFVENEKQALLLISVILKEEARNLRTSHNVKIASARTIFLKDCSSGVEGVFDYCREFHHVEEARRFSIKRNNRRVDIICQYDGDEYHISSGEIECARKHLKIFS